jgi:hypothetical protein
VILKLLLELTLYHIAIYIVRRTRTSLDTTAGDILFDPLLKRIPCAAPAAFIMLYKRHRHVRDRRCDRCTIISTQLDRDLLQ